MDDLDKILEFIYKNYDRFPMTLSMELREYIRQLKKEKGGRGECVSMKGVVTTV